MLLLTSSTQDSIKVQRVNTVMETCSLSLELAGAFPKEKFQSYLAPFSEATKSRRVCVVFLGEHALRSPRFSRGVDHDMLRRFGTLPDRRFLCVEMLGAVNKSRNDGYQ